jgi:hypothetical protein
MSGELPGVPQKLCGDEEEARMVQAELPVTIGGWWWTVATVEVPQVNVRKKEMLEGGAQARGAPFGRRD